jgi:hypothetical protein
MTQAAPEKPGASDEHGKDIVTITVNNKNYDIHRGRRTVAEIKAVGGVPAADDLVLVKGDNDFDTLKDDGSVVIKGGERFLSHPKDSGSS